MPFLAAILFSSILLAASGRGACLLRCQQEETDALLRLKASFRFYYYERLPSWKSLTNCCAWEGVTCGDDGSISSSGYAAVVTALNLSSLYISGNLSSSHLFKLTSLRFLSLAYNSFDASPWPALGFQQLPHLQYLDLSFSGLSGDLPVDDGQLSNLATLNFSGLHIKRLPLQSLIANLGSLQELTLHHANISVVSPADSPHASSPTNIAPLSSGLKSLSIKDCTITGGHLGSVLTDPRFLPMLANLVTLDLSGFDLRNFSLHALIGSLSNLENLHLENVNISATTCPSPRPPSTNTTSGLKDLLMMDCTITGGDFNTVLAKLPFLSTLNLDGTKFSGPPPVLERFAELSSLAILSLASCGLTGTFPSLIFHMKSLISLDLSWNENLSGELPEFVQGSALQILDLSRTKFSGEILESIGNLRNLTWLGLSDCQFHGPVPTFTQWPMLSSIYLSGNNLTSSLPSDGYLALHNLTAVDLSNNSISGVIPASLFSLPSLEFLSLSQNNLTGNFLLHPNISSNLRLFIDLSNNRLQGPVPKLLSELVGMYWLDLSSNNFTGNVDLSFIKNYKELDYLSLSYNMLSVVEEGGNQSYAEYPIIWSLSLASCNLTYVPEFLMHQRSTGLDLSNNNIGGHIPDWIWGTGEFSPYSIDLSHNLFTSVATNLSHSSVIDLDLHSNKIEGVIPLPPSGTSRLDYSNNHFSSSIIPEFWSHVGSAISLSLAHNSLSGEISNLICNATDIGVLDLSFNNLSGLIPLCLLKHNKTLEILNLRGNNFNGSLPHDISEECALQVIDLNGNKLEGKVPVSMINCAKLKVIDLGNNLIMDMFPEWLGVLPLLKVLVLRANQFHGTIDHYGLHPFFFSELQVLDLSLNSFNGSIPIGFLKQLKAMMVVSSQVSSTYVEVVASVAASPDYQPNYGESNYRESVTVTLKGQETTLIKILSVTTGNGYFAECQKHSAKTQKHSAKPLPSVALGKEHTEKELSAKGTLPSAFHRALGKAFAERKVPHSAKCKRRDGAGT
ncbi:hypothetical protein PAHAL_4G304800 [Panicum hallii]|jgi:Leucine-rich repeat (LRR) protein|uniref:Leucine-rich repeat-containing N-terminal plant-type domain-containing protein n=1 Tax=Panicum hallii TaxID=206008 RepID=A0A2T8JEG2_9POAL|nr:hypothetical protein PAHAL_4G304800 [Panicum hallii]